MPVVLRGVLRSLELKRRSWRSLDLEAPMTRKKFPTDVTDDCLRGLRTRGEV